MLTAGRMSPVPVPWGTHCTWGWVRVSFGNPGMGKARMLESAQEGERGQVRTGSPRAAEAEQGPQCPFGVWRAPRAGLLRLPLTGIKQLMCPEKSPFLPCRFECWPCHLLAV